LSCEYGLLGLGGDHGGLGVVEGNLDGGEQILSVTGTMLNINAALQGGIIYTPRANWNGVDVVEVTVDDRGNGGKTLQGTNGSLSSTILLAIDVSPINDAPTFEIPAPGDVREDQDTAVAGLSVRDVDLAVEGAYVFGGGPGSADGGFIEVTLSSTNGTTTLGNGATGYTFLVGDGVANRLMSFRASLAGAIRALGGLTYRGEADFYGTDELVVTVDDGGSFG
ncbi:unnamed protein product, partial [Hapterophycus canaliculatus]